MKTIEEVLKLKGTIFRQVTIQVLTASSGTGQFLSLNLLGAPCL